MGMNKIFDKLKHIANERGKGPKGFSVSIDMFRKRREIRRTNVRKKEIKTYPNLRGVEGRIEEIIANDTKREKMKCDGIPSGCAISGLMSEEGRRIDGSVINRSIAICTTAATVWAEDLQHMAFIQNGSTSMFPHDVDSDRAKETTEESSRMCSMWTRMK